eukprot:5012914-Prymnesium_polylepis.1
MAVDIAYLPQERARQLQPAAPMAHGAMLVLSGGFDGACTLWLAEATLVDGDVSTMHPRCPTRHASARAAHPPGRRARSAHNGRAPRPLPAPSRAQSRPPMLSA